MDNYEIDELLALKEEHFFLHIEETYGQFVKKILRYHDIDNYTILSKTDRSELIDFFENPNDENATEEFINLKKEICYITQGSISLKSGTKNKILVLLKFTQDIMKKKKLQFASQARLNQSKKHRSQSSSLSTDNYSSDSEDSETYHHMSIKESIRKLLANLNNNIHGTNSVNLSVDNFKIIIESADDNSTRICSIQCICGDRIKLYAKNNRFQTSNFAKHLKLIKTIAIILVNNSDSINHQDSDDQSMSNDNNSSINQSKPTRNVSFDANENNISSSGTIKKSNSQNKKIRIESINNESQGSSNKRTEYR
ncbi:hypothetical protein I4U23_022184 [Adineta vaga]|nr:hypothetical protein I4U23_022184 [Adineta vaga]